MKRCLEMAKQTYLTASGKTELEIELDELKRVQRPQIAERIRTAKEFGEMPEGGEFDEAKNQQAFVEAG